MKSSFIVPALMAIFFFSLKTFAQQATSSDALAFTGVNLSGAEFDSAHLPGVYGVNYSYPTVSELDYFHGKGLNLIRLPFRWERIQPTLKAPLDAAELQRIKNFVQAADARGMSVILDVHNYGMYKGVLIGNPSVPISAFQDLWGRLAVEFKGQRAVWGYDLMNEPSKYLSEIDAANAPTPTGVLWSQVAQAAIDAIRAKDTATMILVEGVCDSNAARWAKKGCNIDLDVKDPSQNFRYSAHVYFDYDGSGRYLKSYDSDGATSDTGVQRLQPWVDWLNFKKARGFVGEYGVPNNDSRWLTVLDHALSYMLSNCLPGTYWSAGPRWGSYPLSVEPASNGQDQVQMSILTRHLENPSCASGGSTPLPAGSDTTPPVISGGSPSGTLSAGTSSVTLKVTTNETASCRYGTVSGRTFSNMSLLFSTSDGRTHSAVVSGLSGGAKKFAVRCRDSAGNANTSDYFIGFSISTDSTPPVVSGGLPTGTLAAGTTAVTMKVGTNENATCRYSTVSGRTFQNMAGVFTTTGAKSHSVVISGLTDGSSKKFAIRCKDAAGNVDTSDYFVQFSIAK